MNHEYIVPLASATANKPRLKQSKYLTSITRTKGKYGARLAISRTRSAKEGFMTIYYYVYRLHFATRIDPPLSLGHDATQRNHLT